MPTRGYSWYWTVRTGAARPRRPPGWRTWLRGLGLEVVTCRGPGGTALGERAAEPAVGAWLGHRIDANRAALVHGRSGPARRRSDRTGPDAGRVVVSDRYLLANIVYQGSAGGLLEEEIALVGMVATGGLMPDLTIVLDIAPEAARARVGPARDRIEERPLFYHERVRAGDLGVAQAQHDVDPKKPAGDTCYPAAGSP